MVIILSNEATATGENAISCDLDRPLFPPLFLKWTKRRKSSAIERQHLSTFWGWKRRRAVESKKKKWPLVFGLTLATQSVSGKWTAQREKKGKTRLKRDKKNSQKVWRPSLTLSERIDLLPVVFVRSPSGPLSLNHCPFPFSQPTWCFPRETVGSIKIFWMGHKSATGIGDRVKVVGDGQRDKAR